MNEQNSWQMNRAGLVNFWYYDEETFHFSDGKLLLRGSNGSGKSVTMQSFLPVLLDGKKSPDRLDPFGSKARKMEDYLLGEKDVADRDERTGYLFIEYKRKNSSQYVTTGIGLRAKRHKNLDFWGFVLTDNRRIGKDFFLYKEDRTAGHSERIPLNKKELEQEIGEGGRVVHTQREYMGLVNKYVFGFDTTEAYDELIKLLIQLRSPKLSKDFKPTVIYGILEDSLPEMSEEELKPLSDTIESMDQTRQQLEQLEGDENAISRLSKQYDEYNSFMLADRANEFVKMSKAASQKEEQLSLQLQNEQDLIKQSEELQKEEMQIKNEKEVLLDTKRNLQQHEVFNAEEQKQAALKILQQSKEEQRKKQQILETKEQKEHQLEREISEKEENERRLDIRINDHLDDLDQGASEAAFWNHQLNADDFKRNRDSAFDFQVWKNEAAKHSQLLQHLIRLWRESSRYKERYEDASRETGEAKRLLDEARDEERKWNKLFQEEKNKLHEQIISWMDTHPILNIENNLLEQSFHKVHAIYEPYTFESIKQPFTERYSNQFKEVNKQSASLFHELQVVKDQLAAKEEEFKEWNEKKDPEPERCEQTNEARNALRQKGIPFLPLFKATEFKEHVSEADKERLEAALHAAGLLDALILHADDAKHVTTSDKWIQPSPIKEAETLADWLEPSEGIELPAELINSVLASISVKPSQPGQTTVSFEGKYQIGLIRGSAPKHDSAQYIGMKARENFRQKMIEKIQEEINELQSKQAGIRQELDDAKAKEAALDDAFQSFPTPTDVQEAYDQTKEILNKVAFHETNVSQKNLKEKELYRQWESIYTELRSQTRSIDLPESQEAYEEASIYFQTYTNDFTSLQMTFSEYQSNRMILRSLNENAEDTRADIDELKGELNVLEARVNKETMQIAQIEKRLEELGAEDIRKQITEVSNELTRIDNRLPELAGERAKNQVNLANIKENIRQTKIDAHHYLQVQQLTEKMFLDEEHFTSLQLDGLDDLSVVERAKKIQQFYADVIKKENRTDVSEKLTKVFYREQQTLVEYRLTEERVESDVDFSTIQEECSGELELVIRSLSEKSGRTKLLLEYNGKRVSPYFVKEALEREKLIQQEVLNERDRELYEEIILNSVGRMIRARILRAEHWVKKINSLMEKRDSSSGLTFSIKWRPKTAEAEEEMDTAALVDLLRSDPRLLKTEDMQKVTAHFRSKITRARELSMTEGYGATLHQVIKEILDYRRWFVFTLYFKRENEPKKELTNHVFFTFSGGEKAMAMYIPLFSAAYSRYQEAGKDAPYIISLDEAFAGVDEMNIRDMFGLVEELGFNYIMNSQALWGDYDSVSGLSIAELVRPKNAPYVTVIRYHWNGNHKKLVTHEEDMQGALL